MYAHLLETPTDVTQLAILTRKVLRSFPKSMFIFIGEVCWVALLAEVAVNNTVTK